MQKFFSTYSVGFLILLFLNSCHFAAEQNPKPSLTDNSQVNTLALSDIHFDPLYNCPDKGDCSLLNLLINSQNGEEWDKILSESAVNQIDSHYGDDTNYALLQDMLINKKQSVASAVIDGRISFVMVIGDFIAHGLKKHYINLNHNSDDGYKEFVKKLFEFLSYKLSYAVGKNVVVFPVIGNNDSYVDDYYVDSLNSNFYLDTASSLSLLYPRITQSKFVYMGYYLAPIPKLNVNLIVLNSNLFSVKATSEQNLDLLANEQLNWLTEQLENTKRNGQKAIIAFHIPPVLDAYKSIEVLTTQWKADYQSMYLDILKQYKEQIFAIFNSHTHSDGVYVNSYDPLGHVSLFTNFISSISPVHANNPSFKIFHFIKDQADNFIFKDIDTYYYDLKNNDAGITLEYKFNEAYNSENVFQGVENLMTGKFNELFFKYYNVNTKFISNSEQKYFWCAAKFVEQEKFSKCIE